MISPKSTESDSGHCYILASIAFFFVINRFAYRFLVPLSSSDCEKHRWNWSNVFASLIHSCITGTWVVLVSWLHPEIWDDLINGYHPQSYTVLNFCIGKCFNSFVDIIFYITDFFSNIFFETRVTQRHGKQRVVNMFELLL